MKEFCIGEDEAVCANCRHYHQHYAKWVDGKMRAVFNGHCVYPRNKNRCPSDTCANFEKAG